MNKIKQLLLTGISLFCVMPGFSQAKKKPVKKAQIVVVKKMPYISPQLTGFLHTAAAASVSFTPPPGFKEIKAPNNEDYTFDYGMELPGIGFEVWFQVRSQKENYTAYERSLDNKNTRQENPDSLYIALGNAQAIAFSGSRDFTPRNIPARILDRYNADAGKSYLLNLPNMAVTKHYKYALLITLQRDQIGTILAVCLTNEKSPEFFKNMDKASNCLKFKP
ncbi:hypothetical protein [Mucilaginibacter glaciei]|uniref:DUF4251 domain-containing protein n=1 Tax=Mucilaginibacter glaciei TaxID=2772109 RepID=A0A926NIY9_9SPHI|nr:hypothetical protein [Mucilaginibacter glaciei]MBD1392954.1 hypothetical protein [Mucilaginibacter glaciei]